MGLCAASASVTDRLSRPGTTGVPFHWCNSGGGKVNGTDERRSRHAGVDWSWETHAVCVVDDDGQVVERFTVAHSARGLGQLAGRLRLLGVPAVAIERGDGPIVQALLEAELQVFVISSRQVKALRLRYGTAGNKDDR